MIWRQTERSAAPVIVYMGTLGACIIKRACFSVHYYWGKDTFKRGEHDHYIAVVNIYTGKKKKENWYTSLSKLNLEAKGRVGFDVDNTMSLCSCIDILRVSAFTFRCVNADDSRKAHGWIGLCLFVYWNKHHWILIQLWHALKIPHRCSIRWYNSPSSGVSSPY